MRNAGKYENKFRTKGNLIRKKSTGKVLQIFEEYRNIIFKLRNKAENVWKCLKNANEI